MARLQDTIRSDTNWGQTVAVGDVKLTPQSQSLVVRRSTWGFVWSRPIAVEVARGAAVTRVPIVDLSRLIRWALMSLTLTFTVGSVVLSTQRRRE